MHIASLLATVVACVTAKNSYVVVAPTSFRPGIPLSIGVNILNSSAPVIVTASLAVPQSVDIQQIPGAVASGEFHQGTLKECRRVPGTLELPVPENIPSWRYFYKPYLIQIKGTGHGLNFQNQSTIGYRSKGLAIFIQTDKAMYKPGQTVNFRAFATFPNLTVYTGPLNVDITLTNEGSKLSLISASIQSELPRPIPPNSVDTDHECTLRIYFDNTGDNVTLTLYNVTLTSQKPF